MVPQRLKPHQKGGICGTAKACALPGRAFPEFRIDCEDFVARLKPHPSHDLLHFAQNFSQNEKLAYYFWREGHDLSRADLRYPRRGFSR